MGNHRHRRHSKEPKLRLVQMYLNSEASLNGLAQEHDISRNLIRACVDKFHKGELSE
jgi:transposase-like protein